MYYDYDDSDASTFYSSIVLKKPRFLPGGTHFYAVKARVLDRLIPFLEHLLDTRSKNIFADEATGFHMDFAYVDTAFYKFSIDHPDIVYVIACPILGWQRDTRSDVEGADRRYAAWLGDCNNRIKTQVKKVLDYYWPAALSKLPNASIRGGIIRALRA